MASFLRTTWLAGGFVLCASGAAAASHAEKLTKPLQGLQYEALREMQWREVLTDDDKGIVADALESDKDRVVTEALKVIAIYHLDAFLPKLDKGVGKSHRFARTFGRIVADALRQSSRDSGVRLLESAAVEIARKSREHAPPNTVVTSLVVIEECRRLRKGQGGRPLPDGLGLTDLHRLLLQYSRLPRDTVIASVLRRLGFVTVVRPQETNLLEVLATYGHDSLNAAIDRLCNVQTLRSMTPYGRKLLLESVSRRLYTVPEDGAARLKRLLSAEDTRRHFKSPVSLRILSGLIQTRLRCRDLLLSISWPAGQGGLVGDSEGGKGGPLVARVGSPLILRYTIANASDETFSLRSHSIRPLPSDLLVRNENGRRLECRHGRDAARRTNSAVTIDPRKSMSLDANLLELWPGRNQMQNERQTFILPGTYSITLRLQAIVAPAFPELQDFQVGCVLESNTIRVRVEAGDSRGEAAR